MDNNSINNNKDTKTYTIPVYWEMYGYYHIQANSLEEAIEKANLPEIPLPNGTYTMDSFHVDEDAIEIFNSISLI